MIADRDTRRLMKQAERDRRIDGIYLLSPELKNIDQELAAAGKDGLRRVWEGGDVDAVKGRIAQLLEKKRLALQTLGYNEGIYDVAWDCPICEDRGFVRPGETCACQKRDDMGRIAEFGLSSLQRKQSFGNFSFQWYDRPAEVSKLVERVKVFAGEVACGRASGNIFLYGQVGNGKTHLCSAVANQVLEAGKTVFYTRADEIVEALREDIYGRGESYRGDNSDNDSASGSAAPVRGQLQYKLARADLLILEDLGTERLTDFAEEQLIRLIDQRINWQKPWMITSHLVGDKFTSRYDPRLVDRVLGEGLRLYLNESSIRFKRAQDSLGPDA